MYRSNVLVCGGTGCTSSNSGQIIEKLNEEIRAQGREKMCIRDRWNGLCLPQKPAQSSRWRMAPG